MKEWIQERRLGVRKDKRRVSEVKQSSVANSLVLLELTEREAVSVRRQRL